MLNITSIEDALYQWVYSVAGITAIFSHPNAPRPVTSYVLINVIQSMPVGIQESESTLLGDDTIDVDYSNVEELFISINVYYAGAYQTATKLKDSLGRITVMDALFAAGLGYNKTSEVRDIPEEINKQWEERAQFDCFFFTRSLDEENIETIRKVEITDELNGSTTVVIHPDDV